MRSVKKFFSSIFILIVSLLLPVLVSAAPVTYTYEGYSFTDFENELYFQEYTAANRITATLTTIDGFLDSTSGLILIDSKFSSWTFSDGNGQITERDWTIPYIQARVTDGQIVDWDMSVKSDVFNAGSLAAEVRREIVTSSINGDYAFLYDVTNGDSNDGWAESIGSWSSNYTVPIPGAVWLLGTGLIGLVGVRRKFGR